MSQNRGFTLRGVLPVKPLVFSAENCTSCNCCVDACPMDILLPASAEKQVPTVAYPEECWYCGCCVMECPTKAIELRHPLMNQARWVEKASLSRKEEE